MSWELLGGVIAIATLALTIGGLVVNQTLFISRIDATAKAARAIAEEAKSEAAGSKAAQAQTARDLADFRERAAREYASVETIRALEDRLLSAIDRIGDRLDKLFGDLIDRNQGVKR